MSLSLNFKATAVPSNVIAFPNEWTEKLKKAGSPPHPLPLLSNVLLALRAAPEWKGVIAFNEFAHVAYLRKDGPWGGQGRQWTDNDDRLLAEWLQARNIHVSSAAASEAVQTVAREHSHSPLLDYLTDLVWDGTRRVDYWLTSYLGTNSTAYTRAIGRCWLISAVARAFEPGCKADGCLIIEGPQGKGKSTALRVLAGDEFFSDHIGEDLSSKDASYLCAGAWIIELSELESLHKSHVSAIKAFLSRTEDRFRPAYGRYVLRFPRQCVFAGTTNGDTYLRDETGGRRFWPVRCGHIDIKSLTRDREQIWAEAVHLYLTKSAWWLDEENEEYARIEQSERLEDADAWQDRIARWLLTETTAQTTSVGEVLERCFKKLPHEWTQTDQNRVARALKALGWHRYRESDPPRQWRYRRLRF